MRSNAEVRKPGALGSRAHETEVHVKAFRLVAALVALLLAVAGCSGSTSVFEMKVGDCFDDPGGEAVLDVETISCDEPHDFEVFFIGDLQYEGTYPGDSEVSDMAGNLCLPHFTQYVGSDFQTSTLNISTLYPSYESWTQLDDREVVCALNDLYGQKLTGSARDSGL